MLAADRFLFRPLLSRALGFCGWFHFLLGWLGDFIGGDGTNDERISEIEHFKYDRNKTVSVGESKGNGTCRRMADIEGLGIVVQRRFIVDRVASSPAVGLRAMGRPWRRLRA
jgi:hypothetical protein